MKSTHFLFLFILFVGCRPHLSTQVDSVNVIEKTLTYDGRLRHYLLFIPDSYSGNEAVPLLFSFHGAFGSMWKQFDLSGFHHIAERENFILVTPQSARLFWNAIGNSSLPDDVGFIEALIEELTTYNIDTSRIYCAGSSNGGFFSFQLACQLSDRIAAIASVKGGMRKVQFDSCQAERAVPILQLHGTEDKRVDYSLAEEALSFWIAHNQTSSKAIVRDVPDADTTDGSRVEYYLYEDGQSGSTVEHFRVIGGGHDWFGAEGNMDIHASEEVWKFFSKHTLDGRK
ncbi:MAG: hypothetical protein AAGC85_27730 [Bacteroidota bacterium]